MVSCTLSGCTLQPGDEITFQRVEVDSFGVTVVICTDDNHTRCVLPLHTIDIELVPVKLTSPAPSGVPLASGIHAAVGGGGMVATEYLNIDGAVTAAMSGAAASLAASAASGLGPAHVGGGVAQVSAANTSALGQHTSAHPPAAVSAPGGFGTCVQLL